MCANGVPPLQAVVHWPLAVGPSEDDNDAAELQANSQQLIVNSQAPFSHADYTDYTGERGYQRYREEYTLEAFESRFAECLSADV